MRDNNEEMSAKRDKMRALNRVTVEYPLDASNRMGAQFAFADAHANWHAHHIAVAQNRGRLERRFAESILEPNLPVDLDLASRTCG